MSGEQSGTPYKEAGPSGQPTKSILSKTIGLSIHVDTRLGLARGVPVLLELLRKRGVKASFFVPMGKDHYGWTVRRVFTRKGFVGKASRMGVRGILETYGLRTLLYGLLLPGPSIPKGQGPLLRRILEDGHELGIHGLDHVSWHDHIKDLDLRRTREALRESVATYREAVGSNPVAFAAPGWMVNPHALAFFEEMGFAYTSDTRGEAPFLPVFGGKRFDVLQIPTSLPTLDEVLGLEGSTPGELSDFFLRSLNDGLNILTVHAELEGRKWAGFLDVVLAGSLSRGFRYQTLGEIAKKAREANVPADEIVFGHVRGRAGEVCCQKHAPRAR